MLVIVAGGISAGRHAISSREFPESGWWQSQAWTLSSNSLRVLAIDWIGADGTIDCPIDPLDQAQAIKRLLDDLSIDSAAAFLGASYGAMVGMHLAATSPAKIGALLAISGAERAHPYSSALRSLQRQAIRLGEQCSDGEAGVALARAMAMLTYRTPDEFEARFNQPPIIEHGSIRVGSDPYLAAQGQRHCKRMNAVAYRRLSESIDLHCVDPKTIPIPMTLVAVSSDLLVPSADVESLAAKVPGAKLHHVQSYFGHDAFLKEEETVAQIISEFLSFLEKSQ